MADPLDALALGPRHRVAVLEGGRSAVPQVLDGGRWRRATPGDGAAEALLALLAATTGTARVGAFAVRAWPASPVRGERSVEVDQTNESVIVGDAAVVKWATHLQPGPHPAPPRIAALHAAGFTGMPRPWGLVTWTPPDRPATLVASADTYLPGAVDGWTWAVGLLTGAAAKPGLPALVDAAGAVGTLVADMHAGLAVTAATASAADGARWHAAAGALLESAATLHDHARARRDELAEALAPLRDAEGIPVLAGHGDLHVGQVLHAGGRFVVTDFDGNPVLPAPERVRRVPAALDVAGMVQSLAHAAVVARRHADLDAGRIAEADAAARGAFLAGYRSRGGATPDPRLLRAYRAQQVLREIVYAARHLPRWMYVPDAALPALLDERTGP